MSAFVSHDGDNTEVYVATATGKVSRLEEKGTSLNAVIEASYLNHPLNGWLNQDEPAAEILRKAFENKEEINVRIESQRKSSVDRSIPIQELRVDTSTAQKNIIKKLVAVNGVFTKEALTNPEDDPVTGHASSALTNPRPKPTASEGVESSLSKEKTLQVLTTLATSREVSESVVDAVKAHALLAGATPAEVLSASTVGDEAPKEVQNGFSKEAPAFKEFNSDGRLNLGGPSIAASVGSYNFTYQHLLKQTGEEPNASTVEFYSNLLLAIADRIQVSAYGTGFRVDRTAGSHTRIRSTIYTLINDETVFPVTNSGTIGDVEAVNSFVQQIGKSARHAFLVGIKQSQQILSVDALLNSLKDDSSTVEAVSTPTANAAADSEPVAAPDVVSGIITPAEPSEPVAEPVEQEPANNEPVVAETPVQAEPQQAVSEGVEMFPQDLLPPGAINSQNAPSEETVDEFKNFIIDEVGFKSKEEQASVAKLLAYTFGTAYSRATNIPEEKLGDFLDFYVANGVENFKAVLARL